MSDSLWPHGLLYARLLCLLLSPRVCSNSCPLSRWCHPTISSSVTPFFSCPQSFPASGAFSSESVLCIRWPKYWSFSFSFSPSFKYSELISFRMHWFDILAWTVASLGIQENSNTPSLDKPSEICPCYNNLWERPFSLL